MSRDETVSLFDKYDILLYLKENFEVLHTQGHQWLIEEINELINEGRKELAYEFGNNRKEPVFIAA